MIEFDEEIYEYGPEDMKRLSKAAERANWRRQAQEELDELGDLYGVESNILRGISYVRQTYGAE